MKKNIPAILLAAVMVTAMAPVMAMGAGTNRAVQLADGTASNIEGGQKSSVYFGNYMQSDEESKEPVKWRVLDNKNGKLFVLSDMALNAFRYHTERTDVTW